MTFKVCKLCVTPSSRPRIVFNEEGICNACLNSQKKKKIDWNKREKEFFRYLKLIKKHKEESNNKYDCIVPWSGGKDSTSIALKLKKKI